MGTDHTVRYGTETDQTVQLSHFTIERFPDVVIWMDSNGRILRVNDAIRQFGYGPSEFVGVTVFELFPDRDRHEFREGWDLLREHGSVRRESSFRRRDGKRVPVEVTASLVTYEGNEFTCSFIRDISDRKAALEALRESEQQYRNLVEMANDGIIIVQNGIVRYINPRFTTVFGISPDADRPIRFQDLLHPDAVDDALRHHQRHTQGKDMPLMYESALLHRDGHKVAVEFNVGQIPWRGSTALIYEIRDITERKRAEENLKDALRQVEALKRRLEEENVYLQHEIKLTHNFEEIISQNARFKEILGDVEKVASTNTTVLILGETGTGKELIARAIHGISPRCNRPLVKLNCAALPANLVESELFGHEKGAFTGAVSCKKGRFELADGGTIFLDEIGDLPPDLQVKLLRVLQDGEFERLGGTDTLKVDVRVIAATNRDLENAVPTGSFREDLYYRLNVFPIVLPPLRERPDDISLLVNHFVVKFAAKTGKRIRSIPRKVMECLEIYNWPGNIRELENVIERAVVLTQGDQLEIGDWFGRTRVSNGTNHQSRLEDIERDHILRVLERTGWRVSGEKGAAKILGMNPQTLVSRMKRLGIQRPAF